MPAAAPSVDLPAVRAWARENGIKVGDRGRLPAGLVEQFLQANPRASTRKQTAADKPFSKPTATSAARPAATRIKKPAPNEVDVTLLEDEQLELLQDLPAVLEELNAELDAIQQTLKDVQAENGQLKQRLDRLETKRSLFGRK